jgi:hypothetical protein
MKMNFLTITLATLAMSISCDNKNQVTYRKGDLKVVVEAGDAWFHDFPLFLGIKTKNPPQVAIWIEDASGNYLSTIYITKRTGTGSWRGGGDGRPESLPVWSHTHGAEPVDAVSGATPKSGFDVGIDPTAAPRQFTLKIEINHSTDWNGAWPEEATLGSANWSGVSGQPALVYAAAIDLDAPRTTYTATLIGHSSPDGTNGSIVADTSTLTSALNIVKTITIEIQ